MPLLTLDDLHGVPLDWDKRAPFDVCEAADELLEHLNVARPKTVTDESHDAFMRVAAPLMEALPEAIRDAVDYYAAGETGWPWTAQRDESHEELPGAVYHDYLLLRESSSTSEYQANWDSLLNIMEDFCEWASR